LKRIKNSRNGEEGDKSGGEKKSGAKKSKTSSGNAVRSDDAKEKIPNMHLADDLNAETTENVITIRQPKKLQRKRLKRQKRQQKTLRKMKRWHQM
jgi:hypothetical protein